MPMNAPCTAADMDWQTTLAALSRAVGRFGEALAAAGGDRSAAASLLWARSRHDVALREDLAKAACALLALAPGGGGQNGEAPASGWRRRPGPLSKCDRDPEVAAFVRERLGTMPVMKIAELVLAEFGPERAPRKMAIWRYWRGLHAKRPLT